MGNITILDIFYLILKKISFNKIKIDVHFYIQYKVISIILILKYSTEFCFSTRIFIYK